MSTGTISASVQIGGVTSAASVQRSGDILDVAIPVPAGKAGNLTTRTTDATGTLTMADAGHGITTGAKIDLYWVGGMRYGVTVGTVSGTSVPIDLGAGDILPADESAIVACVQVSANVAFDGDDATIVYAQCPQRASVDLNTAVPASVKHVELADAEPFTWWSDSGIANPVAANTIATAKCSNGSTTDSTITLRVLYDATP